MRMSDTHIIDKDKKPMTTTHIDSGDFGKLMIADIVSMVNDSGDTDDWRVVVYCSYLPTKMTKKLSKIYDAYSKASVENKYEETITSVMGSEHVPVLFNLLESYILERIFKLGVNAVTIKASRVRFVDDNPFGSASENLTNHLDKW